MKNCLKGIASANLYMVMPHFCQNCHSFTKNVIFYTIMHTTVMLPSSRPRPLDNAMQCRHVIIKKDDGAKNNRKPCICPTGRFHNKTLLLKESIIAQATCGLNYYRAKSIFFYLFPVSHFPIYYWFTALESTFYFM